MYKKIQIDLKWPYFDIFFTNGSNSKTEGTQAPASFWGSLQGKNLKMHINFAKLNFWYLVFAYPNLKLAFTHPYFGLHFECTYKFSINQQLAFKTCYKKVHFKSEVAHAYRKFIYTQSFSNNVVCPHNEIPNAFPECSNVKCYRTFFYNRDIFL